jgi:hypothetical protein
MRYFVIDANGTRYGPADLPTLNAWAREGRVLPNMMIEEESSGIRSVASTVAGLQFPMVNAPQPQQQAGYAGYTRPQYGPGSYGGQSELNNAWIMGALGLLCCAPLAIGGLINANKAIAMGHPSANGAKIFNIVVLVIWGIGLVVQIGLVASGGLR